MTSIATTHPRLAEQLDSVGQRYRAQRLLRGALLCLCTAAIATAAAVAIAHLAQGSRWMPLVPLAWVAVLAIAAIWWIARPLIWAPPPATVATLLESRLSDLHNGPTNALHLAADDSLDRNGFREAILAEVQSTLDQRPLEQAVPWADLRRPAIPAVAAVVLLGAFALLFPAAFAHGWDQMFHPTSFVPQAGAARLLAVHPGDATLIAGQPLDITADVSLPNSPTSPPPATLIVDSAAPAELSPDPIASSHSYRYSEHLDHVDRTFRYRFEIAGTQSPWFTATVVQQIHLTALTLKISPPPYLRTPPTVATLSPQQLTAAPISVPQGSQVQLAATVDAPVAGALLQWGQTPPSAMNASTERTQFTAASNAINADTPAAVLLTDGAGQIIAKLPAEPWTLHAVPDAPPTVQMQWPRQNLTVDLNAPLTIRAHLADDHGLNTAQVLLATDPSVPLAPASNFTYANTAAADLTATLNLAPVIRRNGNTIRIQVQATDNRQLPDAGPQTTTGPAIQITFADPADSARQRQADADRLRAVLLQMLKLQQDLAAQTPAQLKAHDLKPIRDGQSNLRKLMTDTAQSFPFDLSQRVVQKTLLVLALNPAKDAIDRCDALIAQPTTPIATLTADQRNIIDTLQSLLAGLDATQQPTTAPSVAHRGGQLESTPDAFKQLDEALKQFMAQQQRILNQTASLAKTPVDNYSDKDKALLEQLRQQQDDLDAFLQGKLADFSMLAEQDFSNASLAHDLSSVMTEVTMAKDALKQQSVEIAVPAEESGLELAKELTTNIEKWLTNAPDRIQWTQEDLPDKQDIPMPELPAQLQDMVGQLMEQEEDLLDSAQDQNANITDSGDKGIGWDAMDGPIADMSAKGVTGNTLPNNNEMGGRSGEGRNGQSQGEFVGDSAVGKGGRRTPTRLDPTPFQQGQINDTSTDATGGATGGGKLSGQGSAGLEGPVPPALAQGMQRLATKQADIRNAAERLNLQLGLSRYDNFKLTQSIMLMRRVESALDANHYVTVMRTRDALLDDLATSRLLLAGQVHVQQDTTPTTSLKLQQELDDAAKTDLPPAWSAPLKQYYQKLAEQSQ